MEYIPVDFWLPRVFPDRVRVICTISPNSHCEPYFKRIGCEFLNVRENTGVKASLMQEISSSEKYAMFNNIKKQINTYQKDWPTEVLSVVVNFGLPFNTQEYIPIIKPENYEEIYDEIDLESKKNCKKEEEMMMYFLEYLDDKIIENDSETFY